MTFFMLLLILSGLTPTPTPTLPATELTVLTYNLHMEKNTVEPILDVMRAAQADVVGTVETHYELVGVIDTLFNTLYPYRTTVEFGDTNRTMLMSRYPLLDVERWPGDEIEMLRATIDFDGQPVVIYVVHPTSPGNTGYDSSVRSEQIDLLLEAVSTETDPVIFMGDFNMEEWSDDYSHITGSYIDSFRDLYPFEDDPGLTYPDYALPQSRVNARLPGFTPLILRLDYIFHSADFETLAAQVWPDSGGSDHRPVYAQLRLKTEAHAEID